MTQPKRQSMAEDPFWRSLEHVFHFYRLKLDKNLVYAQASFDAAKPLSAREVTNICKNAGFTAQATEMPLNAIGGITVPAILIMKNGDIRVFLPEEGGKPLLWDPATQQSAPVAKELSSQTATALLIEKRSVPGKNEALVSRRLDMGDWFWSLFRLHRGAYLDVMMATFFLNIFAIALPVYTMNVYDRVVPNNATETLLALTIGIIAAFAFNFAFKVIRGAILENIAAKMSSSLDVELMNHLLRLPSSSTALTIGEKSNLFREVQGLRDFFAVRLLPAVLDLPFFVLFLVVIHQIAPGLMTVVVAGIVLMFVVNILAQIPVNRAAHDGFKESQTKNAALVEMLSGGETLRLFNAVGERLLSWKRTSERSANTARHSQHATTVAGDLSVTIMYLVNVFVIVVGVYEIQEGHLSVGSLIACSILVSRAITPVMSLAAAVGQMQRSLHSLKMIDGIFQLQAEPTLSADYQPKSPFKGKMELRDVSFTYAGQPRLTVENLSLTINPGEKVGLIGRTGAGKSTLLRLLEGNIKPRSGNIFLDDVAADSIHPDEWRHALGVVEQEPFLFAGSLRQNILLGVHPDDVDEEWLGKVLRISGLESLLQQGGYGMDYEVGENGKRLSGGQQQALAIARALVRKPSILLLDEPTGGMDNALEQHVRVQLGEYCKSRTLVMVTHRTTLLSMVDRLVMVDRGHIVADGPRDKVIERLSGAGGGSHA